MRTGKISVGEYCHVFNSGNGGELIFQDERDRIRFLFLILYLQSPCPVHHISSYIDYFKKNRRFNVSGKILDRLSEKSPLVEIINFCLMPNHFHLTLREKTESGVSRYMHKVLVSYTKYFNTKYRKIGHLFAGTFRMQPVTKNTDLLPLSAHIHKSPKELPEWRSRPHLYPWSSYQDYISENRFAPLLSREAVLQKFKTGDEYKKFVETSKDWEIESLLEKLPPPH